MRASSLAVLLFAVLPAIPAAAQQIDSNNKAAATSEASPGTTASGTKSDTPSQPAAKPKPPPRPTVIASVDLTNQRMVVRVDGETRYSWPISSGVAAYPTPTGNFHPQWTAKMWYSRKYDMSPMPHAVFINGGVAVHGTYHVASLGSPASHGCIRLSPANARTFYNLVQRHGLSRTRVKVFGHPHWRGGAEIARRDTRRSREYAENQGNWFWGNSWYDDDEDSAYAPSFTRKRYSRRAPRRLYDGYADGY
jgi:lipoprotein-anchoring transpeptidase ErfK/SrfK